MSIEEKQLLNDIESFLRGEQPSEAAMISAARIEGWTPAISRGGHGGYVITLVGKVWNHSAISDGKVIETGEVCWLDRKGRWARSGNRLWLLGSPEGTEIPIDGLDL